MDRKIIIERVSNGYLITDMDDVVDTGVEVIEESELLGEEHEALGKLLRRVAEWSGYLYDGFSKENLDIRFDLKGNEID